MKLFFTFGGWAVLWGRTGRCGMGCIIYLVHDAINHEEDKRKAENGYTAEQRRRHSAQVQCYERRKRQCCGCSQPRKGYLKAHCRSKRVAGKPLGDDFRDGNARNITPHPEKSKAKSRYENLRLDMRWDKTEEGKSQVLFLLGTDICDGIPVNDGADKHASRSQKPRKPDAELIKDNAPKEEHQEENVENGVASGIEAVFCRRPSLASLRCRGFQCG